jgi:hypothetical protein
MLEIKIDSAAYTFKHGQKVDVDDNGVAGEAFYDDYYTYYDVTTDGSFSSTMAQTASDYVAIDNTPVSVTIGYVSTGSGSSGTILGFNGIATSAPVEFNFSISGEPNQTDYSAAFTAMFAIQQLNENGEWAASTITPSFSKQSNTQNYYALVQLNHKTAYRLALKDLKNAALQNEVNGGKRRLNFSFLSPLSPTAAAGLKDGTIYSGRINVVNTDSALFKEYAGSSGVFWSAASVGSDSEGRNVTVTLTLNNTILTAAVSGSTPGLNPLTADILNKEFKLGLVSTAATSDTFPGIPGPPPGTSTALPTFSLTNPGTWSNNVTFVNIASTELKYGNNVVSPTGAPPERLVLYLDPTFRLGGKNTAYLFISDKYGFADWVFGDWTNYTSGFKGFRAYGLVGTANQF